MSGHDNEKETPPAGDLKTKLLLLKRKATAAVFSH